MEVDYHVHTHYSDDSTYQMEQVVQDAIKKGLDEICFTDHVDYGVKYDVDDPRLDMNAKNVRTNVDYASYYKQFCQLKDTYKNRITLRFGLEFGIQTETIKKYQRLFAAYPFDFILLSIHQVGNQEFWTGDFQRNKTDKQAYQDYYEEMYRVVTTYHDYSCLAHMDLLRRYVTVANDSFDEHEEIIRAILLAIIKDNKGLEINTSFIRYNLPDTTPSMTILQLYHELGGELITIGSDSHAPEELGCYTKESKAILKDIGFTYFATFDKMTPRFHRL
ncbi:histidinol-phosphatase HisJ family protein [Vagococcus acidifermentans]|uniref:Histidinol-phosphatase n=1 Tax=Vagococcus acidifermentans TaxID=564710 RepID=A0A430ASW3_9ENTE|nr:histidinol-phosphatase HisJ family protein [Vagococcus acidifermentans]RSU11148.1 histidinol phosphate phosphatase [Vagococcus acidifermentans]